MEPIGPEGDAYLVPLNMAAAETPPGEPNDAQLAAAVRRVHAQA